MTKNLFQATLIALVLLIPLNVYAVVGKTGTIQEVITWNEASPNLFVFKLSTGDYVYVTHNEKDSYQSIVTMVMSLYMSGKQVQVFYHDDTIDGGGHPSHRLHRIKGL